MRLGAIPMDPSACIKKLGGRKKKKGKKTEPSDTRNNVNDISLRHRLPMYIIIIIYYCQFLINTLGFFFSVVFVVVFSLPRAREIKVKISTCVSLSHDESLV